MSDPKKRAGELAKQARAKGQPTAWFDPLYQQAQGDCDKIPWARATAHSEFKSWLETTGVTGAGRRALVIGCGLGDDAEALAALGFDVAAFDISPRAIQWCRERFSASKVQYQVADLFALPDEWQRAFDFVLEIYTIQALPLELRAATIDHIAQLVTAGGELLVVCHGRPETVSDPDGPPWPVSRSELERFKTNSLVELTFEENRETGTDTECYYRILYQRPAA